MNERRKGLSGTLDETLRGYEIGPKVHALRLSKKMGLVDLGKHSGLSPALLSKIENSKIFPPLGTLLRIAMVFGVGLDHFFGEEKSVVSIARKAERKRFPNDPDSEAPSYYFESLDFAATDRKMSSYLAEFVATGPDEADGHAHDGEELVYVLEGELGLRVGKATYQLAEGDSIYFDSSIAHAYWRVGKRRCRALVSTVR
jgi:transcriptional regulator with XRE-family HTH domain